MLGVGIDWAEQAHEVALGRPGEGVIETATVSHTPAAVDAFVARIAQLEPDPAEVRVVLETRHRLLVERLVEAGYTVVPINPDLIARRRGPAKKKDDPEDARIACLLALDRFASLKPLIPHGEVATELRAIARDDTRAAKDQRRLPNRLRADLLAVFPAALTAHHFVAPPALARAKADTIRLHATQLLAIGHQRRAWEKHMGQLLIAQPTSGDQPGQGFPDGEIYLSMPALGVRLAARVAGEIGDHPSQFHSPNALQAYGGKAPVTRRSGKSELVVARRLACNRHLDHAVQDWAFCSLRCSPWARDHYDALRLRGKHHHTALRALGNRWLHILWHCLHRHLLYDETLHQTNRQRAQQPLAA